VAESIRPSDGLIRAVSSGDLRRDARACRLEGCLFHVLSDAVLVLRRDWIVSFANQTFCRAANLGEREIADRPLGDVLGKGFFRESELADAVRRTMETGAPQIITVTPRWLEGERRSLPGFQYLVRVDTIDVPKREIILLFDDRSEERRLEIEFRRERALVERVVDAVGVALAQVDEDARLVWANGTFVGWFGSG